MKSGGHILTGFVLFLNLQMKLWRFLHALDDALVFSPLKNSFFISLIGPQESYPSLIRQNALRNNTGNPRLPPYPHPTSILPLAQLKQGLSIPGLNPTSGGSPRPRSPTHSSSSHDNVFKVCAAFTSERLWTMAVERRGVSLVIYQFNLRQSSFFSTIKPTFNQDVTGQFGCRAVY